MKIGWILWVLLGVCARLDAQSAPPSDPTAEATPLRVCCRPLPAWSGSKNWFLFSLNRLFVSHVHHCYVDFGHATPVPGLGASFQISGIHPIHSHNGDKQPMPDQVTDALSLGGACKNVEDATPEKVNLLLKELARGSCPSCGDQFHNRPLSLCFNNSNTYVYELIAGAGMTPPKMKGAPGYRRRHSCGKPLNETK